LRMSNVTIAIITDQIGWRLIHEPILPSILLTLTPLIIFFVYGASRWLASGEFDPKRRWLP
jgi:hypothetical protein